MLMTRHFDDCQRASEGDNQSVRSSAPVVSRCFPGGYNVKLYISRGRLAWWLLAFFCTVIYLHNNTYITGHTVITSLANEIMISVALVCLFFRVSFCLFVFLPVSKITQNVMNGL